MFTIKKLKPIEYLIYAGIIVVGIVIDQLTKLLVTTYMHLYESIPLIKDFLHITYTTNSGAAFGMLGEAESRWVFIAVSSVAILAFSLFLFLGCADSRLASVSVAMVVSGGIGNMIDRLGFGFYVNPLTGTGEVVDFIDFCGIWDAIFNGADSFVCVGAGLLVLALILELIKEAKREKAEKDGSKK